ncbi:MAG: indolepyruvate oxidoreductase subunit beta family protein [Pseudomonadales bacterium]|nr:indolepyruvate oxidoreductase subunit beta family protein [Pseudomonadales bacterium]
MEMKRPITLTIAALGGQGGGVVQEWMVSIARKSGYHVQATSVPGVAQRTGATIYYMEFFPADSEKKPVMALMPVAENCDLIIASELVEAARMVQRGFVSSDRTTLVTSSHRSYTIDEKSHLADGRSDTVELTDLVYDSAKKLVMFDMEAIAETHDSVISAAMLGGICSTGVLPFPKEFYEAAIRESGRGVDTSLAAFFAAVDAAENPELEPVFFVEPVRREAADLPKPVARIVGHALPRLRGYQDKRYEREYLDKLQPFLSYTDNNYALPAEVARGLAVWMTFEDTIRIASLKTSPERLLGIMNRDNELTHVTEYMKPRLQELAGTLPAPIGRWAQSSGIAKTLAAPFTRGITLRSSSILGYLILRRLASLKLIRRITLRFKEETEAIDAWLDLVSKTAEQDEQLALEITKCQQLITGYGDTRERGFDNYDQITSRLDVLLERSDGSEVVAKLREAAFKEDSGAELEACLAEHDLAASRG